MLAKCRGITILNQPRKICARLLEGIHQPFVEHQIWWVKCGFRSGRVNCTRDVTTTFIATISLMSCYNIKTVHLRPPKKKQLLVVCFSQTTQTMMLCAAQPIGTYPAHRIRRNSKWWRTVIQQLEIANADKTCPGGHSGSYFRQYKHHELQAELDFLVVKKNSSSGFCHHVL